MALLRCPRGDHAQEAGCGRGGPCWRRTSEQGHGGRTVVTQGALPRPKSLPAQPASSRVVLGPGPSEPTSWKTRPEPGPLPSEDPGSKRPCSALTGGGASRKERKAGPLGVPAPARRRWAGAANSRGAEVFRSTTGQAHNDKHGPSTGACPERRTNYLGGY